MQAGLHQGAPLVSAPARGARGPPGRVLEVSGSGTSGYALWFLQVMQFC